MPSVHWSLLISRKYSFFSKSWYDLALDLDWASQASCSPFKCFMTTFLLVSPFFLHVLHGGSVTLTDSSIHSLYSSLIGKSLDTYVCRLQSSVWHLPKYWPPIPSPPSECVLPPHQRRAGVRGLYTLAGRWGWGVNILEDARHWIGLLQYNPSTGKPLDAYIHVYALRVPHLVAFSFSHSNAPPPNQQLLRQLNSIPVEVRHPLAK